MSVKISTESWLVVITHALRHQVHRTGRSDFNVDVNPLQQSSPNRSRLFEIASEFMLDQLVTLVTDPSDPGNPSAGSTIDLAFSNRPDPFASVSTTPNTVAVHIGFCNKPLPRPVLIRSFLQFCREQHSFTRLQTSSWIYSTLQNPLFTLCKA